MFNPVVKIETPNGFFLVDLDEMFFAAVADTKIMMQFVNGSEITVDFYETSLAQDTFLDLYAKKSKRGHDRTDLDASLMG